MTRDLIIECTQIIGAIAVGIAIVVIIICSFIALKNFKPWVGKSIKVAFIVATVSQAIVSITTSNPFLCMFFLLPPWIAGYLKNREWVKDLKEEAEKNNSNTDTFPKYLQIKQEMGKGKVRVTEVPYDAVQLI